MKRINRSQKYFQSLDIINNDLHVKTTIRIAQLAFPLLLRSGPSYKYIEENMQKSVCHVSFFRSNGAHMGSEQDNVAQCCFVQKDDKIHFAQRKEHIRCCINQSVDFHVFYIGVCVYIQNHFQSYFTALFI